LGKNNKKGEEKKAENVNLKTEAQGNVDIEV
jgi:hypothetical protein